MVATHPSALESVIAAGILDLDAGRTPQPEFRRIVTSWLRREVARRGFSNGRLGACDHADLYFSFLQEVWRSRLRTLAGYAREGRVAGAVRQATGWYVTEALRRHDPFGYCVYRKVLDGLEDAAEAGIIRLDPREAGPNRACIPHAGSAHDDPRQVRDYVATAWAYVDHESPLLPAFLPGSHGAGAAMKRLAQALRDLRTPRVLVADLISWIQSRARALAEGGQRLEQGASIVPYAPPIAWEGAAEDRPTCDLAVSSGESAIIAKADVDHVVRALDGCVRSAAPRRDIAERRVRVLMAWIDAMLRDEDAGARALACRLGEARATVQDDLNAVLAAADGLAPALDY